MEAPSRLYKMYSTEGGIRVPLIVRYAGFERSKQGGAIVDEIAAPEGLNIFACMLGGDDGRTLLMCAAPDFAEHNRSAAREAVLLTTTVEVPHAGLP